MKKILLALTAALGVSCAVPSYNYVADTKDISLPEINSVNTVPVGDRMLSQGRYYIYDAIKVSQPFKIAHYSITPGYYLKIGENAGAESFSPREENDKSSPLEPTTTYQMMALMTDQSNPARLCAISSMGTKICNDNAPFERTERHKIAADSFQQTLIYNGKSGDTITLGYREFSDNMARPAFNNDVRYDLNESQTVGYKGAKIEIIEATNEHITYKLISNFN